MTHGRQLKDYRPQHDGGCPARRCQHCNQMHRGKRILYGRVDFHDFEANPCTCGLAALLRLSETPQREAQNDDHGAELATAPTIPDVAATETASDRKVDCGACIGTGQAGPTDGECAVCEGRGFFEVSDRGATPEELEELAHEIDDLWSALSFDWATMPEPVKRDAHRVVKDALYDLGTRLRRRYKIGWPLAATVSRPDSALLAASSAGREEQKNVLRAPTNRAFYGR